MLRDKKDFDLLQQPEKLGDIVEHIIGHLQNQKMLPKNMPQKQLDQLKEQVIKLLTNSNLTLSANSFRPKESREEMNAQNELINLLTLTITSEFLKLAMTPLFDKRNDDPKELQEKLNEINKKLDDLDKAKTPEEAKHIYDEIITLCNELKSRKDLTFSMKIQIEIIMQVTAPQSRDKAIHTHDRKHLPKPEPKMDKRPDEEDDFTLYLRAIYGDTRAASLATSLTNAFSYGAANATGDQNAMSLVAEANRYDAKGDSSGRENVILEGLKGKGVDMAQIVGPDFVTEVIDGVQSSLIPPPSLER